MKLFENHCIAIEDSAESRSPTPLIESAIAVNYKVLSSAKFERFALFMNKKRSFIKKLNRQGPNTEPCGTPIGTGLHSLKADHYLNFDFCLSSNSQAA